MKICVFIGPTLPLKAAEAELPASYLPPVSQGDVYRASLQRPDVIAIVDGYFEHTPAVSHKEILWAISQGIHVYGSSSMGALRAAELADFGMRGVGEIFSAYRDGELEDDDEVAVAHAPAEDGYRVMSEAMVNIRKTLERAQELGLISPSTRQELTGIAKGIFYRDRHYRSVLHLGEKKGLPADELTAFEGWLPEGQVNQKRIDALAMLRAIRESVTEGLPPLEAEFPFEYTQMWENIRWQTGNLPHSESGPAPLLGMIIDELRLAGDLYTVSYQETAVRALSLRLLHYHRSQVSPWRKQQMTEEFCQTRGLAAPEDLERWMGEHQLTRNQFDQLMEDEARVRQVGELIDEEVRSFLPDQLRISGVYKRLLDRARKKQRVLLNLGLAGPAQLAAGSADDEITRWYFLKHLGRSVPADTATYARQCGFGSEEELLEAIRREFHFIKSEPKSL